MVGGNLPTLKNSIRSAQDAGVDNELLRDAKKRRTQLEEERKREAERVIRELLYGEAKEGSDLKALAAAIERAEHVGIDEDLLEQAREAYFMGQPRNPKVLQAAEQRLRQSLTEGNEKHLRDALRR